MAHTKDIIRKLHYPEDNVLGQPGLYTFWTLLYIASITSLSVDTTTGNSRDFLLIMSAISTLFPAFSGINAIYGNKLPSTMFLVIGPMYQYFFWQMLAYYRTDVYGTHPIGVMNGVFTGFSALFTVDAVIKTWLLTTNTKAYLEYSEEQVKANDAQNE
uniref:Uncharacterized protein n=1 Tax=viral metagenome TaxID=1070528 RepID=A0A6C0C4B6_9ZZZZ